MPKVGVRREPEGAAVCSSGMSDLSTLLMQRYGADAPVVPADANFTHPILDTLLSHKSVRAFKPDPLPPGTLELLGAAAQSAASSSNLQTWSAVAIQDKARKEAAAKLSGDQDFIRQAPLFFIFCADLARLTAVSAREGLPGEALEYTEMFLTAVIDAALAAQNMAVAAEGLRMGICYVGSARNHPQEMAELLNLPPRVIGLFGLAVGWPADNLTTEIKPRLPQPGLIHHETYDAAARDESVTAYNRTMRTLYTSQQMNTGGDWSQHSAKRVAGPQSLMGRDVLRQILEERGFGLK